VRSQLLTAEFVRMDLRRRGTGPWSRLTGLRQGEK
jgi:hypothetical protein